MASRIEEAKAILEALGLPPAQTNRMAALTFLALCRVGRRGPWKGARRQSVTVTKGVMDWMASEYGEKYAPNTRETVRRQVLHQFVQANVALYNPDEPELPTNSPKAHYAISEPALRVARAFGTRKYRVEVERFRREQGALLELYAKDRERHRIPIRLADGRSLRLSPGKHNRVIAAVVNEFAPQFAPEARALYLGDTADKDLAADVARLASLGVPSDAHGKLPDVVLLDERKNWLFLVEAVTSHGPVTPKRFVEMERLLEKCTIGRVYVSAFPDFAEFRRHAASIAWDTEVWVAEMPTHLIHYNGDRFLGPRGGAR